MYIQIKQLKISNFCLSGFYYELNVTYYSNKQQLLKILKMWANLVLRRYPLYKFSSFTPKFSTLKPLKKLIIPTTIATAGYFYFINKWQKKAEEPLNLMQNRIVKFEKRISDMQPETIQSPNKSYFNIIYSIFTHTFRFFQLILIFLPAITLFPLALSSKTKNLWLDLFVRSVEWAGVVWIKAFQYMSHRRDMIGPQMADKFVHLRENAPQHSFKETKKNFRNKYGKQIDEIFEQFEQTPLASGSVSQVYQAKYKGKKVAVKVRHPDVDKYIERDVNLLFFFSKVLSMFSNKFYLPVSETSMKKTLIDQIDFNNEHDNLLIFNQMFKGNKSIRFPLPFTEDTCDSVLVQSFAQGVPITYFETNRHQLNSVIARLGATTFFEMLMKNNFIHADCHGGNMLVQIKQKKQVIFSEVFDFLKQQYYRVQEYFFSRALENETLRKLYIDSKKEEKNIRKILRECRENVTVTLIDVGMVIRLDQTDCCNFCNFLKNVLHGNGEKCAQMIYNMSSFEGKKLAEGTFIPYLNQLKALFGGGLNGNLDDLKGVQLLTGMLDIIREQNMKLQGQFATLITNMLVLEGMAKDIDPEINILKCAIPYFKYFDKSKQSIEYYEPKMDQ